MQWQAKRAVSVMQVEWSQAQKMGIFFFSIDFKLWVYTHCYKSKFAIQLTATAYTVTEIYTNVNDLSI